MSVSTARNLPRRRLLGGADGLMPWTDAARIFERCTGCSACAEVCPEAIVHTGRGGHPHLAFERACTFCGACAEACPEEVFDLARVPAIAAVAVVGRGCLEQQGVSCRACEDACPELALKTRPLVGGRGQVEVDRGACTGCGACVSVCPVSAVEVRAHG